MYYVIFLLLLMNCRFISDECVPIEAMINTDLLINHSLLFGGGRVVKWEPPQGSVQLNHVQIQNCLSCFEKKMIFCQFCETCF